MSSTVRACGVSHKQIVQAVDVCVEGVCLLCACVCAHCVCCVRVLCACVVCVVCVHCVLCACVVCAQCCVRCVVHSHVCCVRACVHDYPNCSQWIKALSQSITGNNTQVLYSSTVSSVTLADLICIYKFTTRRALCVLHLTLP